MGTTDRAELALTGYLPFVVIAASLIAYPLSRFLLSRYRAAVVRTMSAIAGEAPSPKQLDDSPSPAAPIAALRFSTVDSVPSDGHELRKRVRQRPWLTLHSYAVGGLAYALTFAVALRLAEDLRTPLQLVVLTFTYAWPIVIAALLIVPRCRWRLWRTVGVYMTGLAVLSAINRSADPVGFWAVVSFPSTLLLFAFVTRRVRAVGVMVLSFWLLSVAGAVLAIALFASSDRLLLGAVDTVGVAGGGAWAALVGIIALGLASFAVVGWFAIRWIRAGYASKRFSDQSLLVDGMWFVFAMTQSVFLAFAGAGWYLTGVVAFVLYKLVSTATLRWSATRHGISETPRKLLFLRVFALGRRSEPIFDALTEHWRYLGNVQMIAGPDLAATTVEPHEFLEYLSGRVNRSFIDSTETASQRFDELDEMPDRDGRYRVLDFFCYDNTWREVLQRLAHESDAVVMDVREFTESNVGVIYELRVLVDTVPVNKVVLVTDDSTEIDFLQGRLSEFWAAMSEESPNRELTAPTITMCRVTGSGQNVEHVLDRLAGAAL